MPRIVAIFQREPMIRAYPGGGEGRTPRRLVLPCFAHERASRARGPRCRDVRRPGSRMVRAGRPAVGRGRVRLADRAGPVVDLARGAVRPSRRAQPGTVQRGCRAGPVAPARRRGRCTLRPEHVRLDHDRDRRRRRAPDRGAGDVSGPGGLRLPAARDPATRGGSRSRWTGSSTTGPARSGASWPSGANGCGCRSRPATSSSRASRCRSGCRSRRIDTRRWVCGTRSHRGRRSRRTAETDSPARPG